VTRDNVIREDIGSEAELLDYLDRFEEHFNAREPEVLAFLPEEGRFDRLRREARALLDRYPRPAARPALFGVPVGVKDIFHVEGFITRAGSRLPPELFQGAEAESVTLLKNAGALITGKTASTEFAYFAPGPTRNPHNLDHTPGGSSSGSAGAGHADDRIDYPTGGLLRRRRLQAELRPDFARRRHSAVAFAGSRRRLHIQRG
jgi:Asp-tRNA(Asn)/Glu-tRNA(Gln) amidotransferase A subunit family amidase